MTEPYNPESEPLPQRINFRDALDPLAGTIDGGVNLKPERIQFTDEPAESRWGRKQVRQFAEGNYELESFAEGVMLLEVIATHADPNEHYVYARLDDDDLSVIIVPRHSDTLGDAELDLIAALETAWAEITGID